MWGTTIHIPFFGFFAAKNLFRCIKASMSAFPGCDNKIVRLIAFERNLKLLLEAVFNFLRNEFRIKVTGSPLFYRIGIPFVKLHRHVYQLGSCWSGFGLRRVWRG